MKFSTVIVAAAASLPAIEAHMRVTKPTPYNGEVNSPLEKSGANFPCMNGGQAQKMSPSETYTPGEAGSFKITGGATHGGGSCQVSITYDNPPNANSKFKVIQSYHGSCPYQYEGPTKNKSDDPNDDGIPEFPVTFPDGLKKGEATFVWTWFNRLGNREMYMNCAAIEIGGNGDSDEVFDALPDMFVANLDSHGSQCITNPEEDLVFPNPGDNVVEGKGPVNLVPACGGKASQPKPSGSGEAPQPKPSASGEASPPVYSAAPQPTPSGSGEASPPMASPKPPVEQAPGYGQENGTPVLVDVGKNPVSNPPPSASYTPINSPVEEGSGDKTSTPVPDDDNTGKKYGASCTQDGNMILCDGAPAGYAIQCFEKGRGWLTQVPVGVECKDFASTYVLPKAPKFKRHAHEHYKRLNRAHRH